MPAIRQLLKLLLGKDDKASVPNLKHKIERMVCTGVRVEALIHQGTVHVASASLY